jgi:type II secretory pathway predicted ATPase ExeA
VCHLWPKSAITSNAKSEKRKAKGGLPVGKNPYGPIPQNDRAVRAEALKLSAGERGRVRTRLREYLARTGLTHADFAIRINYAPESLYLFLRDKYHKVSGNAGPIGKAIVTFMDAHPIAPSTQAFGKMYDTANVRAMRATFEQLLRRPVAYMIYAPPGSQKSFVLEHLVAELNVAELSRNGAGRRAYYIDADVEIRPTQIVKEVAMACGISSIGDRVRLRRNLAFEFQGRRALLVIDEAQHLSLPCFEALRILLDRPPHFSLLFAGSHDLKQTFDRFSATLEQWNSRILDKVRLPGVERAEAEAIVERELGEQFRLITPNKALKIVRQLVDGATAQDAFEVDEKRRPRRYINVRTLTNAIDDLKMNPVTADAAEEQTA